MIVEDEIGIPAMNELGLSNAIEKKQLEDLRKNLVEAQARVRELETESAIKEVKLDK